MTETTAERRAIRRAAGLGLRDNRPVVVVSGDTAPTATGESWHYETLGGRRIHHPSGYAKKGWSNMRYVSSTLRVEVGEDWVQEMRRPAAVLAVCEALGSLQTAAEAVSVAEARWAEWGTFDEREIGCQVAGVIADVLRVAASYRPASTIDGAAARTTRQPYATPAQPSRFESGHYDRSALASLPFPEPRPRVDRGDGVTIEIDDDSRYVVERESSWRAHLDRLAEEGGS